jgi:SAM-dependent methyltransferase
MRPIRYAHVLAPLFSLKRDSTILEVGCGEGSGLRLLSQIGFKHVIGCEVSIERLSQASSSYGAKLQLVQSGVSDPLPFPDASFDAVVSAAVIEHALDQTQFVREVSRVLKPGGLAIVSSDCFSWRILQWLRLYSSIQPIDQAAPIWELQKNFAETNLECTHITGFSHPRCKLRFLRILLNSTIPGLKYLLRSHPVSVDSDLDLFTSTVEEINRTPPKKSSILIATNYLKAICSDENILVAVKRASLTADSFSHRIP